MVRENFLEDSLLTRLSKALFPKQYTLSDLCAAQPQSVAEAYPDVPVPENPLSPLILAARWKVHDLNGEDMPGIAADLLEAGFDSPSLRRLAGEICVTHTADIAPLVDATFRELGFAHPFTERDARLITSRQIAREVIHGRRNPWAAASHLEISVWGWQYDLPEVLTILDLNDQPKWDLPNRPPVSKLEQDMYDAFADLALVASSHDPD